MNIIVFNRQQGRARQFDLRSPLFIAGLATVSLLVFGGVFAAGSWIGAQWAESRPARQLSAWAAELGSQREQVAAAREVLRHNVEAGAAVAAVATGVVTWAGARFGYGNLVEVNHGNGYLTRYAHNSAVLVKVGDTVQKGQELSLLGSTGHSTGPHVHFEVLKDGSPVDPMAFINQNTAPLLKAGH